jgi:hypothetical protein
LLNFVLLAEMYKTLYVFTIKREIFIFNNIFLTILLFFFARKNFGFTIILFVLSCHPFVSSYNSLSHQRVDVECETINPVLTVKRSMFHRNEIFQSSEESDTIKERRYHVFFVWTTQVNNKRRWIIFTSYFLSCHLFRR